MEIIRERERSSRTRNKEKKEKKETKKMNYIRRENADIAVKHIAKIKELANNIFLGLCAIIARNLLL